MAFYSSEVYAAMKWCNAYEKNKLIPTLPSDLQKKFKKSKGIVKYLPLVINGEFLGGVLGKLRAELHSALIEHSGIDDLVRNADKKTICFSNFVDTIQVAKRYFEGRGFMPLVISAETNHDVFAILNTFKTSNVANPLLATIQSLSTGVTLVCANVCIFLNQPFRSFEYEQASARVFRIGQDTQVYLYDLMLDTGTVGNLSTRMSEIQTWSKDQSDVILNKNADITMESTLDYIFSNESLLQEVNGFIPYPGLEGYEADLPRLEIQNADGGITKLTAFDWN